MGGNSRALDRSTGKVKVFNGRAAYAEPIDFRRVDKARFFADVAGLMNDIHEVAGYRVWSDLCDGHPTASFGWHDTFYSGSSFWTRWSAEGDVISHKPVAGDVDVMVPLHSLPALFEFFSRNEGRQFAGNKFTLVGQNRLTYMNNRQLNPVFEYRGQLFLQVDFEGVDFVGRNPTSWARFSHCASSDDIIGGFKGVCHKFLLTNMFRALGVLSNAVVLTPKSGLPGSGQKVRTKKMVELPRRYAFSVTHGLREKLRHVGTVDGHDAYIEIEPKDSTYVTDVSRLGEVIFGSNPQHDTASLWSFVGLVRELKHMWDTATDATQEFVSRTMHFTVEKSLWGAQSQRLSRDAQAHDMAIKDRMLDYLVLNIPGAFSTQLLDKASDLRTLYYQSYVTRPTGDDE